MEPINTGVVIYAIFAMAGITLLIAAWAAYKIRRVHLMLFQVLRVAKEQPDVIFRQLDALIGLYHQLELTRALPATREWAASPDFLLQLALHARCSRPAVVVECGSGTSTVVLAQCMKLSGKGHVYSLDHDPRFAEKTRQHLRNHRLEEWATVLDAPLSDHRIGTEEWRWYRLDQQLDTLAIDMLVVDGPPVDTGKTARYPAGPLLFGRVNPAGAVFVDDAKRPDERAIVDRWLREFPGMTVEQRACEKGCAVMTWSRA